MEPCCGPEGELWPRVLPRSLGRRRAFSRCHSSIDDSPPISRCPAGKGAGQGGGAGKRGQYKAYVHVHVCSIKMCLFWLKWTCTIEIIFMASSIMAKILMKEYNIQYMYSRWKIADTNLERVRER